jgi:hypothetical protein
MNGYLVSVLTRLGTAQIAKLLALCILHSVLLFCSCAPAKHAGLWREPAVLTGGRRHLTGAQTVRWPRG